MVEQEVEVTGPERVMRGAIKRHVRIPAAALIPLAAVRAPRGQRPRFAYLLLSVLEPGLSLLLFDVGLSRTSATHAALLLASETLFVVLLARLTLRERLSPPLAVAVGAGVGGATLASLEPGGAASSLIGDTLVLAASALAAGYGVLARKLAPTGDWLTVTATQLIGALGVCLPNITVSSATGHSDLSSADAGHLLAAVATGALASVIPLRALQRRHRPHDRHHRRDDPHADPSVRHSRRARPDRRWHRQRTDPGRRARDHRRSHRNQTPAGTDATSAAPPRKPRDVP